MANCQKNKYKEQTKCCHFPVFYTFFQNALHFQKSYPAVCEAKHPQSPQLLRLFSVSPVLLL